MPLSATALRQKPLRLAAADSPAAGLYDFAAAIVADPRYHLVGAGPYTSRLAAGTFMIWKLR